jgi:CxxC motif-containing protein/thioredoxin reductase
MDIFDVVIIGGGPAGLAAAISAKEQGANTLIIEREKKIGGILKQCIHDGFGLITFKEKLSGPEYAERYIKMVKEGDIPVITSTYVVKVEKQEGIFTLTLVNSIEGNFRLQAKSLILANGCRERTSKQVFINGTRPAGVFSAGTAQYLVNINGYLPCKKCVILGSGDIGLIMAKRLTLEGTEVVAVYEAKDTPSGLSRNLVQCLEDYSIPLHLSHTITRVFGDERVEAVEVMQVDENMKPIKYTEEIVGCDAVILSVGLIPENEIAEMLGIEIDTATKGPLVDQNFMTNISGTFSCGNALHVNDLVDYVSESGKLAGESAALYVKNKEDNKLIHIAKDSKDFLYIVPQYINSASENKEVTLYFRSREVAVNAEVQVLQGEKVLFKRKYKSLKPPEMERIKINLSKVNFDKGSLNIVMYKSKEQSPIQGETLTCIVCPNGCTLSVEKLNGEWLVQGNLCPRGKEFAITEMTSPMRTICTTVRTIYKDIPRLSVRTDREIPKNQIFSIMEEINKIILERRVYNGDIIIENILNTGANIIATSNMYL